MIQSQLIIVSEISGNDRHLCVTIQSDRKMYENLECYTNGVVGMCLVHSKTLFCINKL